MTSSRIEIRTRSDPGIKLLVLEKLFPVVRHRVSATNSIFSAFAHLFPPPHGSPTAPLYWFLLSRSVALLGWRRAMSNRYPNRLPSKLQPRRRDPSPSSHRKKKKKPATYPSDEDRRLFPSTTLLLLDPNSSPPVDHTSTSGSSCLRTRITLCLCLGLPLPLSPRDPLSLVSESQERERLSGNDAAPKSGGLLQMLKMHCSSSGHFNIYVASISTINSKQSQSTATEPPWRRRNPQPSPSRWGSSSCCAAASSPHEQARIAEEAGASAVVVLERVLADIRSQGGVARMSDPALIKEIRRSVTIPVMAKARTGHFVEAQILEAIGVDYVDESEVLTPADDQNHINKHNFLLPFVCGCRDLGEALRRICEGASMIRTMGEVGTGNFIEDVRHVRSVMGGIRALRSMDDDEVFAFAKRIAAPFDLVMQTKQQGRLPVALFAAGGVTTPADAALMMQLGCDGVFVGSGIFNSADPARTARAIVQAVTHYTDPEILAEVICGLGEPMAGINLSDPKVERFAYRLE
ncbi:hypothetical protein ZIOFF_064026 [Zingiber officinale]|uniref:pyridoxal 5'-phosphate synthase (glutamine hydrolyzing) n=1 Tax=Zingiber officinale TaxID=94328 RepID=A0A8J5BMA1_ZINOF|nr:hypothetical protein ZIOFF_064026 [Zingiber officinale]